MRMHAIVSGNVQGVFFRAFTKKEADKLGLVGWSRNNPDGILEAVFDGSEEALEEMRKLLHKGPPAARVDKVVTKKIEKDEEFKGFEIRY